jgi:hypothetical protein
MQSDEGLLMPTGASAGSYAAAWRRTDQLNRKRFEASISARLDKRNKDKQKQQ